MKGNAKLIIFLDRQKIVFVSTQVATALTLDFPSTVIMDLEVVDPDGVNNLLSIFIDQNKIPASEIIIITSDTVYYELEGSTFTDQTQRKKQLEQFLATIPFKNLLSKDYNSGTTTKLIALNKDFYEPIVRFFKKANFNVIAILPLFVLDRFHLQLANFSPKEAKDIYQKYKLLENSSLITTQDIQKSVSTPLRHQHQDQGRTIILLAVFGLLLVVFLGFIFIQPLLMRNIQPKNVPISAIPIPTLEPTTIPTPTISYLAIDNIRLKVLNSSGTSGQAAKLKLALTTLGYTNITAASAPKLSALKNQIIYSPLISPEFLQQITNTVETLAGPVTQIQSSDLTDQDIQITTVVKTTPQITP